MRFLEDIKELFKIKIALASTITGVAGYAIRKGRVDDGAFYLFLFLLFLASGACALNQVQERKTDAIMDRTKNRPVASGRMSVPVALLISLIALTSGLTGLLLTYGATPALSGLIAILWYNLIYTNLKRRTVLAPVVGALLGMFPPQIGWLCAGGNLTEFPLIIISGAMFIYQVPHFLLLFVNYEDDYRRAGFPVLTLYISKTPLMSIIFLWSFGLAVSMLMFIPLGIANSMIGDILLLFGSFAFIYYMYKLTRSYNYPVRAFLSLNVYIFLTFCILILERVGT